MTNNPTPPNVAKLVEALTYKNESDNNSPINQRWEWGVIKSESIDQMVDEYRKTLEGTKDHFGESTLNEIHGLFINGTDLQICTTGISPNSPNTAKYILSLHEALATHKPEDWEALRKVLRIAITSDLACFKRVLEALPDEFKTWALRDDKEAE